MVLKCDACQDHIFAEKDVAWIEMAGPDWYPYEGNVLGLCCPVCGYISEIKEDEGITL